MDAYELAEQYAISRGVGLYKITLLEFSEQIKEFIYPDIDMSFKDYFLEIISHGDKFEIPHSKLVEYGVMSSTRSSAVLEKLMNYDMVEGKHFKVQDVKKRGKSGGTKSKLYMLTPDAFKICLIKSKRFTGQRVDPMVYLYYFLLLEKTDKWYNLYQLTYSETEKALNERYFKGQITEKNNTIAEKTDKIDELLFTMKNMQETFTSSMSDMSNKLSDSLYQTSNLEFQVCKLQSTLEETQEEASIERSALQSKIEEVSAEAKKANEELANLRETIEDHMEMMTKFPSDPAKQHYACVLSRPVSLGVEIKIIAQQHQTIERTIKTLLSKGFTVIMDKMRIANGVDLRNNVGYYNRKMKSLLSDNSNYKDNLVEKQPKLGAMKTFIPDGCVFTMEIYKDNLLAVIKETNGRIAKLEG